MAVAKCDNTKDVINGGSASLSGNITFYNGRAETVGDPTGLKMNQVSSGRYLAGNWRGEVLPQTAADVHAPADNTAAVVTYSAVAERRHVIFGIVGSYNAAPTGGNIKIEDGAGTTIFSQDIAEAGTFQFEFPKGLKGSINTAMIITLAAGGDSVGGELTIVGRRVE